MKFKPIVITSRSVTLEMQNTDIVSTNDYELFVNGELYTKSNLNVVSVFNLNPDTEYEFVVKSNDVSEKLVIKTLYESVCLNVRRFGAKGDGKTNDTNALQAAILACPDNGRVYIPEGDYYTSALFLRSNITIEISKYARLVGDIDRNHYPVLPGMTYTSDEKDEYNLGSWEGNPLDCFARALSMVMHKILIGGLMLEQKESHGDLEVYS